LPTSTRCATAASTRLPHGHFYGQHHARRQVGTLVLTDLRPTVPEHEVERHTHDDAHVLLLLGGRYLSSASGMPAVCDSAALVLNPPGTTHRDCFRGLQGRFFTLSWPHSQWRNAAATRRLPGQALRLGPAALARASSLWRELQQWDSASTLAVQTDFELMLDEAALDLRLETGAGPAWLERARERLADEWQLTPTIAALAGSADVHPVYLARAFSRRYGCTPADYLRRCRLDRALALLHAGRESLTTIAANCGFADQSHFSHAFRRAYRCTPSQYRTWAWRGRQVANLQGGTGAA
jgi:AraC family transcriptional regulator